MNRPVRPPRPSWIGTIVITLLFLATLRPAFAETAAAAETTAEAVVQETCEVGAYLMNLTDLDFKTNSFRADYYLWFKTQSPRFEPDQIEFMNGSTEESKAFQIETRENGIRFFGYHQKGTFHVKFPLDRYPFDAQTLEIHIENARWNLENMVFLPDSRVRGSDTWDLLATGLGIESWILDGADLTTTTHLYKTDFGDPTVAPPGDTYSRAVVAVRIRRILLPILQKFMLPMLIILMTASLTFFLPVSDFRAQCSITITSLLSAIAYHISQADTLPAVGYMTTVDKFFMLSYAYIFLMLVEIVAANHYSKAGREARAQSIARWTARLLPTTFTLSVFLIFWWSYTR